MKKVYLTLALCCALFNSQAQLSDVITNIGNPTAVFVDGDNLYFGDFYGGIYRANLNSGSSPTLIVPSNGIYRSDVSGDELYITHNVGGYVSKFDITEANPSSTTVASMYNPTGIVVNGSDVYVSSFSANEILKINLTEPNPSPTVFASGFISPAGMDLHGNYLYVSEFDGQRVSRIDITQSNPTLEVVTTGLSEPTEVLVDGDRLFVSEFAGNRITVIDLSENPVVVSDYVTGVLNPTGLFMHDSELYISVFGQGKIVKYTESATEINRKDPRTDAITAFPNPAQDRIQIQGLSELQNCVIYNAHGAMVMQTNISSQRPIDLQNFESGVYFIRFENGNSTSFVKH